MFPHDDRGSMNPFSYLTENIYHQNGRLYRENVWRICFICQDFASNWDKSTDTEVIILVLTVTPGKTAPKVEVTSYLFLSHHIISIWSKTF